MRVAPRVAPFERERSTLESWSRDPQTPAALRRRAAIVLRAAEGGTNLEIATEVGASPATVGLWRRRFAVHGIEGIRQSAPRPLHRKPRAVESEARILRATRELSPPSGGRWTTRTLARYLGLNHMQVFRVWKKQGIEVGHPSPRARVLAPGPWVDVVGSFRCLPLRAILFAVDPTGRVGPHWPNLSVSGGTRVLYVPAPGTPELRWSLEELRELLPNRGVPVANPYDLLIFLRSIERRAPPGLRFHLLVECRDAEMRSRLRRWLVRRPEFTAEIVSEASAWRRSLDRFLHTWDSQRLQAASFRAVGPFTEALARFAARSSPAALAFSWSFPLEIPRDTEAAILVGRRAAGATRVPVPVSP